jgi:1,4-dihydroxy-2-naphthoate octaprenyltransferase
MSRLPEREVNPSKERTRGRPGVTFGRGLNVSVPISFGLPLLVIGLFLGFTAAQNGSVLFWALGGLCVVAGVGLFASGKRL